jgi:phenylacetate-CoA ligase
MDYKKFTEYFLYFKWLNTQSRHTIESIRLKNLRKIVAFAFENSNFYRKIYSDVGLTREHISSIELKDLPFTNKKILMANFDDVVTDKRLKKRTILQELDAHKHEKVNFFKQYEILRTSGTSGLLGIFPIEIADLSIIAAAVNHFLFSSIDYILHNWKRCKFLNCVVKGPYAGTILSHYSANKLMLDKHLVSITDPLEAILEKVNLLKPDLLAGYSNIIRKIASENLKGTINISPKAIICSGDGVNINDRQVIQEAFGIDPIDYYATTENLFVGFKKGNDYFSILDPLCYVEKGSVTNLINKVFPIINYQTDDHMNFIEDYSENPFTKVILDSQRMEQEMTVINNYGKIIPLNVCIMCSLHVEGLFAYQISKKDETKLLVKVSGQKLGLEERVKRGIMDLLSVQEADKRVTVDIEYFDEIPPDSKTGKFRIIV